MAVSWCSAILMEIWWANDVMTNGVSAVASRMMSSRKRMLMIKFALKFVTLYPYCARVTTRGFKQIVGVEQRKKSWIWGSCEL